MARTTPKKPLRNGYTTGTCAAAAAKGAVLTLLGHSPKEVSISLPLGETVNIPLHKRWSKNGMPHCTVIKDGGDDPDVTHGAVIGACIKTIPAKAKRGSGSLPVIIKGGTGVGLVTKPGLPVKTGEAAINPIPRKMIRRSIREAFAQDISSVNSLKAVEVTLFVPEGKELARKTFNPRLGIIGGISILGTTGIVKPFSHQAYRETICCGLDIAKAARARETVLSTGGMSERFARRQFPRLKEEAFIQMGDYVGYSLNQTFKKGFRHTTIAAFMGKLSKIAAGSTYTHARSFPLDIELLVSLGKGLNLPGNLLQKISRSITTRGILKILLKHKAYELIDALCQKAVSSLYAMGQQKGTILLVLYSFDGKVLWYGGKEGKSAGIA
jgi:cobalt-precorrin-5B (C1)-methyltransferase